VIVRGLCLYKIVIFKKTNKKKINLRVSAADRDHLIKINMKKLVLDLL